MPLSHAHPTERTHYPQDANERPFVSDRALTPSSAAKALGVRRDVVMRLIADRRLPAVEVYPRAWRISRTALEVYLLGGKE